MIWKEIGIEIDCETSIFCLNRDRESNIWMKFRDALRRAGLRRRMKGDTHPDVDNRRICRTSFSIALDSLLPLRDGGNHGLHTGLGLRILLAVGRVRRNTSGVRRGRKDADRLCTVLVNRTRTGAGKGSEEEE